MSANERSFEQEVFLQIHHKLFRHFEMTVRRFPEVRTLGGSGNVFDAETSAKFFQTEVAYPFDPAELRRDNTKLCAHIAAEVWKDLVAMLAPFNIKPDAKHRLFILATPELKPAWLEEIVRGDLKGALQLSIRLTLAAPDHLPFGMDGPKLLVPRSAEEKNRDTDLHAAREEGERAAMQQLRAQKEALEDLTRIDLDAPTKKD